jgi:hypothetical protein
MVTVPTARPALVMAEVAAAWVWPTTLGTVTPGGPDDTMRATAVPLATLVPPVGVWLMTLPAATVLLDSMVTVPTARPALVMAEVAAAWVWPTTLGAVTDPGELDPSPQADNHNASKTTDNRALSRSIFDSPMIERFLSAAPAIDMIPGS